MRKSHGLVICCSLAYLHFFFFLKGKGFLVCMWLWHHFHEHQSLATIYTIIGMLCNFCMKHGFCTVQIISFLQTCHFTQCITHHDWVLTEFTTDTAWMNRVTFRVFSWILYPKSRLVTKYAFHILFSDQDIFSFSVMYFLQMMDCFYMWETGRSQHCLEYNGGWQASRSHLLWVIVCPRILHRPQYKLCCLCEQHTLEQCQFYHPVRRRLMQPKLQVGQIQSLLSPCDLLDNIHYAS